MIKHIYWVFTYSREWERGREEGCKQEKEQEREREILLALDALLRLGNAHGAARGYKRIWRRYYLVSRPILSTERQVYLLWLCADTPALRPWTETKHLVPSKRVS